MTIIYRPDSQVNTDPIEVSVYPKVTCCDRVDNVLFVTDCFLRRTPDPELLVYDFPKSLVYTKYLWFNLYMR